MYKERVYLTYLRHISQRHDSSLYLIHKLLSYAFTKFLKHVVFNFMQVCRSTLVPVYVISHTATTFLLW